MIRPPPPRVSRVNVAPANRRRDLSPSSGAPTVCLIAESDKAHGVATAARGTLAALRSAGIDVSVLDPTTPSASNQQVHADINLVQVNPGHLGRLLHDTPRLGAVISARPTIGYWVWEAPGLPKFWEPLLPLLEELWVPSSFVSRALGDDLPVPLRVVPHALSLGDPHSSRSQLGLPPDKFMFLFVGNARSNLKRKNPLGLIRAYRAAFEDSNQGTMLIVKMMLTLVEELATLRRAIADRSDILLVSRVLDRPTMASLMAACDCYVSLHRAEGFGLGLAEAMHLAKPVIATGYSGNMEFMTPDTAYLVDSRLEPLTRASGIFPAGTIFAKPDGAHAARLMRHVEQNREEAAATGRRASERISATLSPEAVGKVMKEHLTAFWARVQTRAQASPQT